MSSSPPHATRQWRSRLTPHCSARPTTRGPRSIRSGSPVLPDGTIAYAENPPKKYQDIYPINFDNEPAGVYEEVLRLVLLLDIARNQGVSGRQPHTKPPNFWAWLIGEVKNEDPDVLFLAEGFTRPARLYGLANLGLTQLLHVLHLAHVEIGSHRVRRADHRARRLRPAESVGQYSLHPACEPAARRPRHVRDPGGAGVDHEFGMGRVLRLRAVRPPAGGAKAARST